MSTDTKNSAPVSAEPVVHDIGKILAGMLPSWWVHLRIGDDGEEVLARVYGDTPEHAHSRAAALAAQPGLTQQTLDDVKAGIPARDAEIEALRREIETVQAQQDASKVDAWRTDDVGLHAALSAEFSKHPQTKAVLGREALVLRCVRAAIDAARKEPDQ
ncbi:hypothetical protein [Alcaligenes faecalis]|uniref:hypothetical protein n=1 Tax=Alcaligenes faecalis TaxID=511 RepID=UPI001C82E33E|nr:hypothetical protein [Alcaligenes faecalis]MBX6966042.1 hypothetical protein [Providencia rettgeri]MBX7031155.1 hypothetical protein [Alcaligenes faecalis]